MSINTLTSGPALPEGINISPELGKDILATARSLFKDPDLVAKITERIEGMDNGISKQLSQAALRRVLHLSSSAEQVKENARQRLQRLMTAVEDSQQVSQA